MKFIVLHICLAVAIPVFAQQENTKSSSDLSINLYENALLQVENLIITQSPTDSLIFYLLSDAKDFANKKRWYEGYEILKTIMELFGESVQSVEAIYEDDTSIPTNSTANDGVPRSIEYTDYPTFPFQLEVGVDYSRQEFELSFVENDSTI
ncbi:MAG: hypothetical protein GWN00_04310, partial [Aliifodinibius sp.]|nr:hypothetical protein [Fodinibius sp.]NIV10392.1 hypothetical protein [Fodinibius sp.]NIY24054.1 hypothetical protein [Fodinibius sp.]